MTQNNKPESKAGCEVKVVTKHAQIENYLEVINFLLDIVWGDSQVKMANWSPYRGFHLLF